jgi:hypothetical protein
MSSLPRCQRLERVRDELLRDPDARRSAGSLGEDADFWAELQAQPWVVRHADGTVQYRCPFAGRATGRAGLRRLLEEHPGGVYVDHLCGVYRGWDADLDALRAERLVLVVANPGASPTAFPVPYVADDHDGVDDLVRAFHSTQPRDVGSDVALRQALDREGLPSALAAAAPPPSAAVAGGAKKKPASGRRPTKALTNQHLPWLHAFPGAARPQNLE